MGREAWGRVLTGVGRRVVLGCGLDLSLRLVSGELWEF